MTKRIRTLVVAVAALAALALGGAVFAQAQTSPSAAPERTNSPIPSSSITDIAVRASDPNSNRRMPLHNTPSTVTRVAIDTAVMRMFIAVRGYRAPPTRTSVRHNPSGRHRPPRHGQWRCGAGASVIRSASAGSALARSDASANNSNSFALDDRIDERGQCRPAIGLATIG
jgi:hypothetical protein